MKCPSCGKKMEEGWKHCPECGHRKREGFFNGIFSRFRKEMEEFDRTEKNMEKEFETFDVSDLMRGPASRGFTIRISAGAGMRPKVEVRTMGDVDRKEIEGHLKGMGVAVPQGGGPGMKREAKPREAPLRMPESTKEPETKVRRVNGRVMIEMKLPGIKGSDVSVQEFGSSIEVRALGEGKAFFKIVTKPENTSVVRKGFSDGVLALELG
jgi:HSP20 family molecular chaperone IbpA